MMLRYHRGIVARAESAASAGNLWTVYAAMQRDAAVWTLPALIAVAVCWMFNLTGRWSLWVSVPLVGISLLGCVFYVGAVYLGALKRRANVR